MGVKKMAKRKRAVNGLGTFCKRKDGTIEYKVSIKLNDGTTKRKSFYGKREEDCLVKYDKFKADNHILSENNDDILYEDFLQKWLYVVKQKDLKPSSFDRLEATVLNDVIPRLGYMKFTQITSLDIEEQLLLDLKNEGRSISSRKKAYNAVNASCKYAVGDIIKYNPCDKVNPPKKPKTKEGEKIVFLSDDEIEKFKNACYSKWDSSDKRRFKKADAYIFMLNTGIRMGEMIGLQWNDIDIDNKKVHIKRNVVSVKNRKNDTYEKNVQDSAKTYASDRTIPLNKTAIDCLTYLKSIKTFDDDFVINSRYGGVVPPNSFEKTYNLIIDKAGIDRSKHGTHTLRHTFATHHFKNKVNIKFISKWLGHQDVSTTYNKYIHIIEENETEVFEMADDI
jgi:integrase